MCRSQWPRGLRRRSAAARLLRLWVRIPREAWKFVCCECCVLSGRGLCDEVITRPEESYRLWCVVVCDLEISRMRSWPTGGCRAKEKYKRVVIFLNILAYPQGGFQQRKIQQGLLTINVFVSVEYFHEYGKKRVETCRRCTQVCILLCLIIVQMLVYIYIYICIYIYACVYI